MPGACPDMPRARAAFPVQKIDIGQNGVYNGSIKGLGEAMYKVLIIDDEYWVGKWLNEVLGKSCPEVQTVGVCQDGEEALRFLKDNQVDILITDINMPVVSGLDIIRRAGGGGRLLPKTIIISGYDEFEYARQAIELDVVAYLLKPLERGSLFEAVGKAVNCLDRERNEEMQAAKGYCAAAENLLLEYFQHPGEGLKQSLLDVFCQGGLEASCYLIGLIQSSSLEASVMHKGELREKLEAASGAAFGGDRQGRRRVFLFRRDACTWGFMLTGIRQAAGFYMEEAVLLNVLKGYSWGISHPHQGSGELLCAAEEAKHDIIRKLEAGGNGDGPGNLLVNQGSGFLAAIEARDKKRVEHCADEVEREFLKGPYNLTSCLNFYFILTGDVIRLLADSYQKHKELSIARLIDEGYEFSARIREFYSIRPICCKFEEYCFRVIDCLKDAGPMSVKDIVQKVQRMIRDRYASDLNLGSIADEYSINPSYFSKKFKDETGVNFVEYLSCVRIGQAQSLLANTDWPVSKISNEVGFNDPKYFSKVFLAITGEKPSEYRAMHKEGMPG